MARLALDTNAVSAMLGGDQAIIKLLDEFEGSIVLPVTVYGEVLYGFRNGSRDAQNIREFKRALETLEVAILPVNEQVARQYTITMLKLKQAGRPIPVNDIWIAANCLVSNCSLVTRDSDFRNVEGLTTVSW